MTDQVPAHSPTGASVMKRLRNCPGSLRLSKTVPNPESVYSREGTEAHSLAAAILEARAQGRREPDTFGYPEDMIEYVGLYVEHLWAKRNHETIQLIEQRFSLEHVYPGSFGTADGATYYPSRRHLDVTDLKYGAGVFVEVERNDQLLYYALGAIHALQQPVETVTCEIVQPRIGTAEPIRTWTTDIFELIAFEQEVKDICKATEDPAAPLAIGEWCRFCPAAAADICPLMKEERKALARRVFKDVSIEAVDLEQLAENLRWIPIFEAQFSMMHEYAYTLAMKGQKIPGMKLVDKRPSRAWKDAQAAADRLHDEAGVIITRVVSETMSPAEVEKLKQTNFTIAKKDVKDLINGNAEKGIAPLVEWKSSGYALVPDDDRRSEVKQIEAKTVFASAAEIDALT